MSRVVTRIPQADGSVRVVLAQDARHARIARDLLRQDRSLVDRLDGIDGIRLTTTDER